MYVNLKNRFTFVEPLKNLYKKLTSGKPYSCPEKVQLSHLFILLGNRKL